MQTTKQTMSIPVEYADDLKLFLNTCFNCFKDDESEEPDVICKGNVQIYRKNSKGLGFVRSFEAGDIYFIDKMYLVRKEYYISPDAYKIPKSYNKKDKFRFYNSVFEIKFKKIDPHLFRNIFKDIDYKKDGLNIVRKYISEILESEILTAFANDIIKIYPNCIVRTGSSLQIWFAYNPCAITGLSKKYVKIIEEYISNVLRSVIKKFKYSHNCEFNGSSLSSKRQALARFPGSYDSKSNSYGSFYICNTKRTDIIKVGGKAANFLRSNDEKVKFIRELVTGQKGEAYQHKMMKLRLEKLEGLAKLRGYDFGELTKDFLYIYCTTCITAGFERCEALQKTMSMNIKLYNSVNRRTLKEDLWFALEKGYAHKNSTLISKLQISGQEQYMLKLFSKELYDALNEYNKLFKLKKQVSIHERDSKIISLYNKGLTGRQIADTTGIPKSTVYYVLHKKEVELQSEKKAIAKQRKLSVKRAVCAFLKEGKEINRKNLAVKFNCSHQTIGRDIAFFYALEVKKQATDKAKEIYNKLFFTIKECTASVKTTFSAPYFVHLSKVPYKYGLYEKILDLNPNTA